MLKYILRTWGREIEEGESGDKNVLKGNGMRSL
jgi:hypothetical protein